MTAEKAREIIAVYRKKFEALRVPKSKHVYTTSLAIGDETLAHCYAMLDELETLLNRGSIAKAFEGIAFIQGCLWSNGIYSLEEIIYHNR